MAPRLSPPRPPSFLPLDATNPPLFDLPLQQLALKVSYNQQLLREHHPRFNNETGVLHLAVPYEIASKLGDVIFDGWDDWHGDMLKINGARSGAARSCMQIVHASACS